MKGLFSTAFVQVSNAASEGRLAGMRLLAVMTLGALLFGCAASINERHHIATFGEPTADNPTGFANVLRITIKGNAEFANVRYIAGTYDEHAADLFLNNVKSEPYAAATGKSQGANTIFNLCIPSEEKDNEAGSASGGAGGDDAGDGDKEDEDDDCVANGDGETFLIIMSTNADAIAETIGAFAENEITVKSLNYLLNRDVFDAQQVSTAVASRVGAERKAMLASLEAMFTGYENRTSQSDTDEIAILQTIAVALNPTGDASFSTLAEAREWFARLD